MGEPGRAAARGTGPAASHASRVPGGHPEGYLECFAQIYRDAAELIHAAPEHRAPAADAQALPTVEDGVRGVRFMRPWNRAATMPPGLR